jgi:hypothetical protein
LYVDFIGVKSSPSVFILIILSHGDREGQIFTDHPIDPDFAPNKRFKNEDFVSFTTIDILEKLKSLDYLKDSLKLIFFGVCKKIS